MGCCISTYFCIFHTQCVLLFLVRPSLIYDSSAEIWCFLIHSHPLPLIVEHYKTWEVQTSLSRAVAQEAKQRSWKMYLFEVLLHYHFFKGCCISTLFLYFHYSTVVLHSTSLNDCISWKLMLSNPFTPCTTNSGTLIILRGKIFPFKNQ